MTLTPAAGNYMVWFSSHVQSTAAGDTVYTAIHVAGTIVQASECEVDMATSNEALAILSNALVTVNGSQAIAAYWKRATATASMFERTLLILKVQ